MAGLCSEGGGINTVATPYSDFGSGLPLYPLSVGRFSEGIPARAFVGVASLLLYGTAVLS
jgi:hypothetical protein